MKRGYFLIGIGLLGIGILAIGGLIIRTLMVGTRTLEEQSLMFILVILTVVLVGIAGFLAKVAMAAMKESDMKMRFLAAMSHEIRTPMNGIIGFIELALDLPDIPKKGRDYLVKIQGNSLSIIDTINDITDISKLEFGAVDLRKEPFSLHELFEHLETTVQLKAQEKGLDVYFYSEPFVETKLVGDPFRLRQVLLYILSNGIKYTNSGTIKLMAAIEDQEEDRVIIRFEVKDSGVGMTEDQVVRIFKPSAGFKSGMGLHQPSAGLGLPTIKRLIGLMGGTLSVESAPDIGSKFSFALPFTLSAETDERFIKEETLMIEQRRPTFQGSVLVCEDNLVNQDVVEEQLNRIGLKPVIVENGRLGIDAAMQRMEAGEPFDLILMDIQMPVMDGLEASIELHRRGSKTPIVAMSANIFSQDKEIYRKHGITDYLSKPFVAQELWLCLMRYLKPVEVDSEQDMKYSPGPRGV